MDHLMTESASGILRLPSTLPRKAKAYLTPTLSCCSRRVRSRRGRRCCSPFGPSLGRHLRIACSRSAMVSPRPFTLSLWTGQHEATHARQTARDEMDATPRHARVTPCGRREDNSYTIPHKSVRPAVRTKHQVHGTVSTRRASWPGIQNQHDAGRMDCLRTYLAFCSNSGASLWPSALLSLSLLLLLLLLPSPAHGPIWSR